MTKNPTPKKLTLKIGGQRITADRFLKAVSSFVALINDVSDTVTQERTAFRWIVTVDSGSAIVHFRPEPYRAQVEFVPLSVKAINDGLAMLEKRAERPRFWSDNALRKAKDLSDVLDVSEGALDHVSVQADHRQHEITRKVSAHVHFVIQDPVTHNSVRCNIGEDDVDKYLAAFRKRVAVYGEIRYRKDGEPVSIAVHEFRVLRESQELPRADDVKGILAA